MTRVSSVEQDMDTIRIHFDNEEIMIMEDAEIEELPFSVDVVDEQEESIDHEYGREAAWYELMVKGVGASIELPFTETAFGRGFIEGYNEATQFYQKAEKLVNEGKGDEALRLWKQVCPRAIQDMVNDTIQAVKGDDDELEI